VPEAGAPGDRRETWIVVRSSRASASPAPARDWWSSTPVSAGS